MSYTAMRAAVIAKLESIPSIKVVYKSHKDQPSGFPSASTEPSGHTNIVFTNQDNYIGYSFDIVLYQEFGTIGRDKAVEILCAVMDDVITAFNDDPNLNGVVDKTEPVTGTWGFFTSGNGKVLYASLILIGGVER